MDGNLRNLEKVWQHKCSPLSDRFIPLFDDDIHEQIEPAASLLPAKGFTAAVALLPSRATVSMSCQTK